MSRALLSIRRSPGSGCRRPRILVIALSAILALSGCAGGAGEMGLARSVVPRTVVDPAAATAAGDAIAAFGLDLYRALAAEEPNLVISPASIALALGMARAGARGTTASEMDTVMHALAADGNEAWLNALDAALASRGGRFPDATGEEREIVLRIANAPFAQTGIPIETAYLDALASRYGAGLRLVDYVGATEAARRTINHWVSETTEERIPELITPGVLGVDTRLTLVNAIYLKAPWLEPFAENATTSGSFTRADGTFVDVPFMGASLQLGYGEGDGWRAVEIPYLGGTLAMTIVVPDDLVAFEASLDAARFASIVDGLAPRPVRLGLPRFSIETKASLADLLVGLGMPSAFGVGAPADFSGVTTAEALEISDVIHQANIDVDEKGTEAAAATAVVMRATGMPGEPVVVRADRPFLFAIRDVPTGAVLFLGRVGDPSIGR